MISEPLFHMHSSAPTISEALARFRLTVSDYLDLLTDREATLGPHLRAQLEYLRGMAASQ